jgi:hypothetical protein
LLAELRQLAAQALPDNYLAATLFQARLATQRFLVTEDGQMLADLGRGILQGLFFDGAAWAFLILATLVACQVYGLFFSLGSLK